VTVNYLLLSIFLFLLMLASVMLAGFAVRRQQESVRSLRHLTLLERRTEAVTDMLEVLASMGAGISVLGPGYQSLLDDLRRMRELDPLREDLERAVTAAEASAKKKADATRRDQAAVASERELLAVRNHLNRAQTLLQRFHRARRLSASEFQQAKEDLRQVALAVGVNSFMLMATRAQEAGNAIKAFSFYRKAESVLRSSHLSDSEKQQRMQVIESDKARLIQGHEQEQGLLLMAVGD